MGNKVSATFGIFSLVFIMLVSGLLVACQSSPTSPTTAPATSAAPAPPTSAPPAKTTSTAPVQSTTASAATSPVPVKPASSITPQSGGILKIITNVLPPTWGPIPVLPGPSGLNLFPSVETLVGINKDGPVPTKLATSWDSAPDGKSITFHLRQGVKFQDGTDFNADAVKYNLTQLLSVKPELKPITSIDVVDNYTVRLNLSAYSNTLLYQLAWVDGLMESPTALQSHDATYLSTHLVGTGPFELVSFSRDVSAVFKKFNGYWDPGKPYLDGLEYDLVADSNTAQNAFLAGQGQLWDQVLTKYIKDLVAKGYNLNTIPRTIEMAIGDSANPTSPFAKQQVRQAIEYAVDKKGIVDTFGAGTWEVPAEPCSSRQLGYIPNFQGRIYNPSKAKQLLADAGYPHGFDTTIYARNNIDPNLTVAVQANLKDIGINAQVSTTDPAKYGVLSTKGWQNSIFVSALGISGSYVRVLQTDGPNPNADVSATLSPQYTALVAQAASAQDKDTQTKLNQQLVQLVFDEAIMSPWYIDSQNAVYGNNVHADIETITLQFWNPGDAWLSK